MRVVTREEIHHLLDPEAALAAVADAFRRVSAGAAEQALVGHLGFPSPPGDVHVKSAWLRGDPVFVVKLAAPARFALRLRGKDKFRSATIQSQSAAHHSV